MGEKSVSDNDSLMIQIKSNLNLAYSFLGSAKLYLGLSYGPSDYSDVFKERVEKIRENINDCKTTLQDSSTAMKNNSKYTDYDGVEGTWRYYG